MIPSRRRAFTLIELLTVVAIIGILATFLLAAFTGAGQSGRVSETRLRISALKLKIEEYSNTFGDFPRSNATKAGLDTNGLNDGSECLVRYLSRDEKGFSYQFPEDHLVNTDGDSTKSDGTKSSIKLGALYECADAWGRPLIYLHNRDYATGYKVSYDDDGSQKVTHEVKGLLSQKTGQYHGFTSYQLWSLGPDGKPGTDDDITSWD